MFIYTVKQGDQLLQIANEFQVSVESIIKANGLINPNHLLTGQSLIIPTLLPIIQKTDTTVNGYQYFLGEEEAHIVSEAGPYLSILTPFSYMVRENGELVPIDDEPLIKAAYENQIVPMMCIVNFTSYIKGQNIANVILNNSATVEKLLSNILIIMRMKGYLGLNIDFESVLAEDRERYNEFLGLAADAMHANGYFISSAVAPKTGPLQPGLLYEGIDYEAHGRLMDFVILMTYEWGYRMGPPQAISPINMIRKVLDYAVTVIPLNKIYFGFQIYARDWVLPHVQGQEAETFSCQEALERAVQYNAVIQYDEVAQSPFFRYNDERGRMHEVWFEDARSAQAKFDTVKEYGLAGISYWVLGYPFPQNWTLLEYNFRISKLIYNVELPD
jgi:Predicted glycosyl hydrolase